MNTITHDCLWKTSSSCADGHNLYFVSRKQFYSHLHSIASQKEHSSQELGTLTTIRLFHKVCHLVIAVVAVPLDQVHQLLYFILLISSELNISSSYVLEGPVLISKQCNGVRM